ncbi:MULTISPECIES: hypothetical protein [unclassified Bacillus (in: firmicutes)]|uniref:hypothetical protein n=1 Tax=unclassified Bacillus (in: firmicutes) TaxID=185979 RepID=UPI0008E8D24E|nr:MULTISPECIES: hypothetical protein [unclassified Bacillus (in: firmicutes)]SFB16830.1 hypothetical protein SAMN02799634_10777 [Bacillus sp. UNCCL13]SFQ77830.1 hypothetical protein SAMN04488577_1563 [Bacillus sp. cl95]
MKGNPFLQIISIVAIIVVFICQFVFLNPFVSTWDQVDFSLALERFDLLQMQPHFPGYPYFILGGMFIHFLSGGMVESLTIFSILFYLTSIYPIYYLSCHFVKREYTWLVTAITYTSSYTVVMVNQPISEGAALATLWWLMWSIFIALKSDRKIIYIVPLFFLSALFGIRLSYIPFAIGVALLFFQKWKDGKLSVKELGQYASIAIFFQLIWVAGLVASEGSVEGFIKLSLAFTNGHFQEWGGSVGTSQLTIIERIYYLLVKNIYWTGLSGENVVLAVLYAAMLIFVVYTLFSKNRRVDRQFYPLLWMVLAYFLWSLFAQNIEKARHALPIIIMIVFWLWITLFSKRCQSWILALAISILAVQCYTGLNLVREQATIKPAIYQMADFLSGYEEPIVVYTWEETRVLQYLGVPFSHKRVLTYELFKEDSKNYRDRSILLTNKVVEGFRAQGIEMTDLKRIKMFHSNELFDPVYHDITLYEWGGDRDE